MCFGWQDVKVTVFGVLMCPNFVFQRKTKPLSQK